MLKSSKSWTLSISCIPLTSTFGTCLSSTPLECPPLGRLLLCDHQNNAVIGGFLYYIIENLGGFLYIEIFSISHLFLMIFYSHFHLICEHQLSTTFHTSINLVLVFVWLGFWEKGGVTLQLLWTHLQYQYQYQYQ